MGCGASSVAAAAAPGAGPSTPTPSMAARSLAPNDGQAKHTAAERDAAATKIQRLQRRRSAAAGQRDLRKAQMRERSDGAAAEQLRQEREAAALRIQSAQRQRVARARLDEQRSLKKQQEQQQRSRAVVVDASANSNAEEEEIEELDTPRGSKVPPPPPQNPVADAAIMATTMAAPVFQDDDFDSVDDCVEKEVIAVNAGVPPIVDAEAIVAEGHAEEMEELDTPRRAVPQSQPQQEQVAGVAAVTATTPPSSGHGPQRHGDPSNTQQLERQTPRVLSAARSRVISAEASLSSSVSISGSPRPATAMSDALDAGRQRLRALSAHAEQHKHAVAPAVAQWLQEAAARVDAASAMLRTAELLELEDEMRAMIDDCERRMRKLFRM